MLHWSYILEQKEEFELAVEVEELLSFPHGVLSNPENILCNLTTACRYLNLIQFCILLFLGVSDYILTVCGLPFPALRAGGESHPTALLLADSLYTFK